VAFDSLKDRVGVYEIGRTDLVPDGYVRETAMVDFSRKINSFDIIKKRVGAEAAACNTGVWQHGDSDPDSVRKSRGELMSSAEDAIATHAARVHSLKSHPGYSFNTNAGPAAARTVALGREYGIDMPISDRMRQFKIPSSLQSMVTQSWFQSWLMGQDFHADVPYRFLNQLSLSDLQAGSPSELHNGAVFRYHTLIVGSYTLLADLGLLDPYPAISPDGSRCAYDIDPTLQLPVKPMALPEKGNKLRIPVMTLAAIQLLGGLLRSLANLAMRNDPRCEPALTNNPRVYPDRDEVRGWRSQDLSIATDNHDFWFGRVYYYRLLSYFPELEWLKPAVNLLCGPLGMVPAETLFLTPPLMCPEFIPSVFDFADHVDGVPDDFLTSRLPAEVRALPMSGRIIWATRIDFPLRFLKNQDRETSKEYFLDYISGVLADTVVYYRTICSSAERITLHGLMMGFATSWPLLPLVTLFSFTRSIKQFSGRRWIQYRGTSVPIEFRQASTCGDDAIMRQLPSEARLHSKYIESIGGVLSKTKDVYTPLPDGPHVYVEEIRINKKPTGCCVLSPICNTYRPSSSSNWLNTAGSQLAIIRWSAAPKWKSHVLFTHCPLAPEWRYAAKAWDLPVHFPVGLGGLGVPLRLRFRKDRQDEIFTHYSGLNSFEASNPLNHLNMVGDPSRSGLSWARDFAWSQFSHAIEFDDGTGISQDDCWVTMASPYFSSENFIKRDRAKRNSISFSLAHSKFYGRLSGFALPSSLSPEKFLAHLEGKHRKWQVNVSLLPPELQGGFGLTTSGESAVQWSLRPNPRLRWVQVPKTYYGATIPSLIAME
jgi:hypothetical protein